MAKARAKTKKKPAGRRKTSPARRRAVRVEPEMIGARVDQLERELEDAKGVITQLQREAAAAGEDLERGRAAEAALDEALTRVKGLLIQVGEDVRPCKLCGELIALVRLRAGRLTAYGMNGVSHMETCPQAGEARRQG